jgi:hypothetical protein
MALPVTYTCSQESKSTIMKSQDSAIMVGSYPCPKILDQSGSEWKWQTLAYYRSATIAALKCLIVQAPGANVIKQKPQ